MSNLDKPTVRIAIFASGTGSNATKIVEYFQAVEDVEIALIASNQPKARVLMMAEKEGIPILHLKRTSFYETNQVLFELEKNGINFIVLAGFLWLIPPYLVKSFTNRMLNIHPALLPKYGGKGMYGMHIHRAVKQAGESQSGITIHLVNEAFDEGTIIFQATCDLDPIDDPEDIRGKVLALEHRHFSEVIDRYIHSNIAAICGR